MSNLDSEPLPEIVPRTESVPEEVPLEIPEELPEEAPETTASISREELKKLEEQEEVEKDLFFNGEEETIDSAFELQSLTLETTYQDLVINRLDNILCMSILSACFLFLIFYYSVKRRK